MSVTYPLEILRIRLMKEMTAKGETKTFKSFSDCLKTIVMKEGVKSLYKGYFFSSFLLVPYLTLSFTIYDLSKKWALFDSEIRNLTLAVILGQLIVYPFDTVRFVIY